MVELNKKYQTKDGRVVEIYRIDAGGPYPVIGATKDLELDAWDLHRWTATGSLFSNGYTDADLVEIPDFRVTKHTRHYKKPINYFSVVLNIHEEIKWLATDSSGNLCGHKQKPVLTYYSSESFKYNHGYWANGGDYIKLAQIEFDGDWRKSLMRVE